MMNCVRKASGVTRRLPGGERRKASQRNTRRADLPGADWGDELAKSGLFHRRIFAME